MAGMVLVRRKYHWPEAQLNIWVIIMLAAAATVLGIFADFITVQHTLRLGIPWLFPFEVATGSLAILFIIVMLVLIGRRMLLPGIVLVGTFILFVLWLTGLVETSITLFGASNNVNWNCQRYVNDQKVTGQSINTLAWLQQNSICQSWMAAFAFNLIGTVFLLWMFIMAAQVNRDEYD
ncbi:hypothetical protein L228DRAFT_237597 [Xylona heveae TC161]|uniref:MARVEL domain-containing protein n=1 Tax=Xylona heveae (strain CBS 132557 / TC161) TaxID=1328760 RepID=A0A165IC41_XYLHT|nr:hypothetical protein L228DRAFT_237597 [Xylona heveae TC161]KZF24692.1 hypothetical protein L228DRAFT_237597 [Xylona heveae TC161]